MGPDEKGGLVWCSPARSSLARQQVLREYELIFRGLCTLCAPRRASRKMY
jgi:hypothetical protein